jgi:hypothetical protein
MQELFDIEEEVNDEFLASENDGANFVGYRNVSHMNKELRKGLCSIF